MPITPELTDADKRLFLEKNPALADIMLDPKLSRHQKKLRALPIVSKIRRELDVKQANIQSELRDLRQQREFSAKKIAALDEFTRWIPGTEGGVKIQSNDCSRMHKLFEAMQRGMIIDLSKNSEGEALETEDGYLLLRDVKSFVVQHDWASAFENAADFEDGEWKLPYEKCAFEFRALGKTIIILGLQPENGEMVAVPFAECGSFWVSTFEKAKDDFFWKLMWKQVRAISIALDAEAATHSVIHAPYSLNKKREATGKIPLFDYHIVNLSRRKRAESASHNETHRGPRLHFRRGHWRHFSQHKTWIRWMLVGNPELGFIDKEYRI